MNPDEVFERELERLDERSQISSNVFWQRFRRSRPAVIVLAASIAFLQIRGLPEEFSNTTLDAAAILQAPVQPRHVRLVTIDEHEYQTTFRGISPLDPEQFSKLITAIGAGSPALVVVDIDTSHPMFKWLKPQADLPIIWTASAEEAGKNVFIPERPLGGAAMPPAWHSALDLIPRDERGIIRSYARQFEVKGGATMPSLEYAAACLYKGVPQNTVTGTENELLFDFRYKFIPLAAASVREKSLTPGWPNGILHGAIVVLGGTFKAARDQYPTPTRLMDGAEIVAQGIEAEVNNTGIPRANPWFAGLFQLVAGLGLVVLYRLFSLRVALVASFLLVPLLSVAASLLLFHRLALWAALVPVLLATLITELYSKASLYLGWCNKLKELNEQPEDKSRAAERG